MATAADGGTQSRYGGTVFRLKLAKGQWKETVLHSFTQVVQPPEPLSVVFDSSGHLFGTTAFSGAKEQGSVFQLTPGKKEWSETVLYDFCQQPRCADGASPGPLSVDAGGALYSTTAGGGHKCVDINGNTTTCGTIFKLVPNGGQSQYQVLYAFCQQGPDCMDGAFPYGGVAIDAQGHLFGTTSAGGGHNDQPVFDTAGTVFEWTGSSLQTLHAFCSADKCADGAYPSYAPTLDQSGNVFGATLIGGVRDDGGTVFELSP